MTEFVNLPTVCCVLLPVEKGLLLIRRNRKGDDGFGMLALPGGFQKGAEKQNIWDVAVDEVKEETDINIQKKDLHIVHADTDEYGHNVIFFEHRGLPVSAHWYVQLCKCIDDEVSEYVYVTEPVETAFPMHTEQIRLFFERRNERSTWSHF